MKIRTDFVTNSSSSSFCVMTITMKDNREVQWSGEDGDSPFFQIPQNASKMVKNIQSIESIIEFLVQCASVYEDEEFIKSEYRSIFDEIEADLRKSNFEDISSIEVAWSEYQSDQGMPPEEGCEGESLKYNFETKKCKISRKPDKDFVKELSDMYGDMFDGDDF